MLTTHDTGTQSTSINSKSLNKLSMRLIMILLREIMLIYSNRNIKNEKVIIAYNYRILYS